MSKTERVVITIMLTLFALASVAVLMVFSLPLIDKISSLNTPLSTFPRTLPLRIISTAVHALVLLGSGAGISLFLRKSNYPEFTFFIFGLLSFAGIGILNFPPVLLLAGYPVPYAQVFLRIFYFFWCLGAVFFFLAGLFPNGIPNLKQHTFFVIAAAGTLTVILLVPIDTRQMLTSFPYAQQLSAGPLPLFIRMVSVLGVCNFIAAGIRAASRFSLAASLGMALVLAGNELYFIPHPAAVAAGPLLIFSGTLLYSTMIYREYMWS